MKKLHKKFLIAIAILTIIMMIIFFIPSVANWIASMAGKTSAQIKSWAQTGATLGISVILVVIGIAALAVPWLGVSLILIGLALLAWAVYPLFSSTTISGG